MKFSHSTIFLMKKDLLMLLLCLKKFKISIQGYVSLGVEKDDKSFQITIGFGSTMGTLKHAIKIMATFVKRCRNHMPSNYPNRPVLIS